VRPKKDMASPRSARDGDATDRNGQSSPDEFERTRDLMRRLLRVPKDAIKGEKKKPKRQS